MLKDSACGIRELRKRLTDVAAVIGPNFSQSPCWLSNRKPDQFVLKIFEILLSMSAIEFVCDSVNDKGSIRTKRHQERSEEHTSELQSLMRISYAVSGLNKKTTNITLKNN